MVSHVSDEFLTYAGITRQYYEDVAMKGLRLYNQSRIFEAKRNMEFCECGKLVNSFHLQRHLRTKKHIAAMLNK